MMEQVVLTLEQTLPEFVNNFLLLHFYAGNHMQLCVVIDCLFYAIGPQMELMLRTEVPHTSQRQRNLYRMLDVLANAEEDRNRYRPNSVSARLMHQRMENYATTAGITLRGLPLPYQAPSPAGRNQASGARSQQPAGPATKFAPTDQRSRQTQRLDNRKDGSQRTPEWRANPNRVQQSRSGFAPRSHQTQADDDYVLQNNDGDDAPESDADDHADTVSSHQTEIDNAACNDADADIVAFDYEDNYVNYWPRSTSHQVCIIDQETTADLTK
ncbi:hypothetical protein H4S08_004307 [Coemansia sp. RSA 1365]|nr:hypothetical protein H4S08_004307 [Coemansia sp. RSA 1365]